MNRFEIFLRAAGPILIVDLARDHRGAGHDEREGGDCGIALSGGLEKDHQREAALFGGDR